LHFSTKVDVAIDLLNKYVSGL